MLRSLFLTVSRLTALGSIIAVVLLGPTPAYALPADAIGAIADRNFQTGLHALQNGDFRVGFEILAPLAKQGDKRAQYCIGLLYAQGSYLPRDFVKARAWYRLAAEQGHTNAQNNLGLLFKQGNGGRQDLVQAFIWFDIAARNGNINALRNRENVKELLSPDQLALGQDLASSWHTGASSAPIPEMPQIGDTPLPDSAQSVQNGYSPGEGRTIEQLITPKTLRMALPALPETADPQRTSANAVLAVNIYDRLVEYATLPDGSTSVVPGLATKWDISADGKSYSFTLRDNIQFHNGDTLSAQDVVFTFKRLLAPATSSYNARLFKNVKNVSATDNRKVRITLHKPYAPLLSLLATPWASVLNKSFVEALGNAYGRSPATTCGSGPFALARLSGRKGAYLSTYQGYFRGPARIDGVHILLQNRTRKLKQLFTGGQLDVLDTAEAPELLSYFRNFQTWKDRIQTVRRMALLFVTLNQNLPPFNDVRIRQAFLHAIDRERLLALLFRGQGQMVNGVLPQGMLCTPGNAQELTYNPPRARELLQEAGATSAELTLVQVNQWNDIMARLNTQLKAMAEQAGFTVHIVSMDENAFFELRNKGKAPAYAQLWEADFNDPDTFFTPFFTPPGTRKNSLNFTDKEAIRQINASRTLSTPEARCKNYRELDRRIVEKDAAWLPLFSPTHAFILGPRIESLPRAWNGGSAIPFYATRLVDTSGSTQNSSNGDAHTTAAEN